MEADYGHHPQKQTNMTGMFMLTPAANTSLGIYVYVAFGINRTGVDDQGSSCWETLRGGGCLREKGGCPYMQLINGNSIQDAVTRATVSCCIHMQNIHSAQCSTRHDDEQGGK